MKKILVFIIGLFAFMPFVSAVDLDEIRVNIDLVPGGTYYGDNYSLSGSTTEIAKYSVNTTICPDKENIDYDKECNSSKTPFENMNNLKPGKYKVGIGVDFKEGYDVSNNFKWIVNGTEITPSQCGGAPGSIGCERFFTIDLKDWEYEIPIVSVTGATIDLKAGDKVKFTGKISDEDSKYYSIVEGWCTDEDASFGQGKGSCVKSNGKGYGKEFTTFEAGKTYYYVIEFYTVKDSYKFGSQDVVINGKKYSIANVSGMGDYNFGQWLPMSVTVAPEVKPVDSADVVDKAAAEESTKTIAAAIKAATENKPVKGISDETLNRIKSALNDGLTLTSAVKTENVKENEVKEEVKQGVEEKKSADQKVLGYFDVQVQVLANNNVLGNITELQNAITLILDTREMVKSLPTVPKGKTRIVSVLRFHNGKVDELPATLNEDGTTTTSSSDFSDYVVVYKDVDEVKTNNAKTNNAKTGDNIITYIVLFIVSLCGTILIKKEVR